MLWICIGYYHTGTYGCVWKYKRWGWNKLVKTCFVPSCSRKPVHMMYYSRPYIHAVRRHLLVLVVRCTGISRKLQKRVRICRCLYKEGNAKSVGLDSIYSLLNLSMGQQMLVVWVGGWGTSSGYALWYTYGINHWGCYTMKSFQAA